METYQKTKLITVDEAIAKGRSMLLWPRILLIIGLFFFLFPTALFIMALLDGPPFTRTVWLVSGGVILFCLLVFFLLPFLYWSKTTTRWKLWAFDHADNVHELKRMALEYHLCPAFGSVMDKLRIQSAAEREQWRRLQQRFDFPELFRDDPAIPAETYVYYSNAQQVAKIALGLFFMGVGIMLVYLVSQGHNKLFPKLAGVLIALAPLAMLFTAIKHLLNKEAQLILNDQGFYSKETGFLAWDLLYDAQVTTITRARRGKKHVLNFRYPGGQAGIDITEMSIRKAQLERLMRLYKGRFGANRRTFT